MTSQKDAKGEGTKTLVIFVVEKKQLNNFLFEIDKNSGFQNKTIDKRKYANRNYFKKSSHLTSSVYNPHT